MPPRHHRDTTGDRKPNGVNGKRHGQRTHHEESDGLGAFQPICSAICASTPITSTTRDTAEGDAEKLLSGAKTNLRVVPNTGSAVLHGA